MTTAHAALAGAFRALEKGDRATALAQARQVTEATSLGFADLDRLGQLWLDLRCLDEAANATLRALALDPNQARSWNRLARVEMERDRPAEACDALENVVALTPGRPEVHSNLAGLQAALGRYDAAIANVERAIALKPNYSNPYVIAAYAETDRGRFKEALTWMDRLPRDLARTPLVLTARAEILMRFEHYEEAYSACREAVAKDPQDGDSQCCLGTLLAALQSDQEALAAFDRAIQLSPQKAEPYVRKGVILAQQGKIAEGAALLDRAQALDKSSPTVRYMRAAALDFRLRDEEIAEMESLLREEVISSASARMHLHFALAGAYLQNDAAARVFPHLNAGNRLKRSLISYDADAEEARSVKTRALFSRELSLADAPADNLGESAIFIVGMPRSGTTLIEQILASHPRVHGTGERTDFQLLVRRLETANGREYPDFVPELTLEDYRALGENYLSRIGPAPAGGGRIVDKMPSNAQFAGLVHLALPGARIIHCRRDPFDTCLSCYSKLFSFGQHYSYDLIELGRFYRNHAAVMAHWRAVLPEDRFLEIDYEDVVDDIEESARRLLAFCGLEWSPSCLRFYETNRTVRTASMAQVRQPLYKSSIGRWRQFRTELSPLFAELRLPVPA